MPVMLRADEGTGKRGRSERAYFFLAGLILFKFARKKGNRG